jgi:hypothetical protein
VKLLAVTMFGVGYVLGTKAGRERYEQICTLARKASENFDASGHGNGWKLWPIGLMGPLPGQRPGAPLQRRIWCLDPAASAVPGKTPSGAGRFQRVPSGFGSPWATTPSKAIWSSGPWCGHDCSECRS